MRRTDNRSTRLVVTALLVSGILLAPGCATLAHRNARTYSAETNTKTCATDGAVCPWLVGDALLLIPGVIPGVVAFIVDFSTGEWQHGGRTRTADASTFRTVAAED